jgi:hypothetical protein
MAWSGQRGPRVGLPQSRHGRSMASASAVHALARAARLRAARASEAGLRVRLALSWMQLDRGRRRSLVRRGHSRRLDGFGSGASQSRPFKDGAGSHVDDRVAPTAAAGRRPNSAAIRVFELRRVLGPVCDAGRNPVLDPADGDVGRSLRDQEGLAETGPRRRSRRALARSRSRCSAIVMRITLERLRSCSTASARSSSRSSTGAWKVRIVVSSLISIDYILGRDG